LQQVNSNMEIEELKFSDLLLVIKRYKYLILLITIFSILISVAISYYKPNVYKAQATIEISRNPKPSGGVQDMLQSALMGSSGSDVETQKAILKSRMVILDVMKKVNVTAHIWAVNRFYKREEIYLNTPIKVKIYKGLGIKFKLLPINDNIFQLEFKTRRADGSKVNYKKILHFNKIEGNEDFKLKVVRTKLPISAKYYEFIIYDPQVYADILRKTKIKIFQLEDKSNILGISYEDNVAQRATKFVNTLAKVYMKKTVDYKTQQAKQTLDFINKQLEIIKKELKKSELDIRKFKIQKKTIDIQLTATQTSKALSDYENKMGILNMQISILQSVYNKIKRGADLSTLSLVDIGLDKGITSFLINELQKDILDRKALLRRYTPAYPDVQKLSIRIKSLKRTIRASIYNMLKNLNTKKAILKKQMAVYQRKLEDFPKMQQDYLTLQRKFEFNSKLYNYLLEKKTEAEIKKAAIMNQNRIIDLSISPEEESKKSIVMVALFGLLEGLVIGIILSFVLDFFDGKIKSEEDIKKITSAPILASIPKIKLKDNKQLMLDEDSPKELLEGFRILRTNLELMIENENTKVITVVSNTEKEGKTTIAINLAHSLQMIDKRVLILNLDLRKPINSDSSNNSLGLSDYLLGKARLDDILKHTKYNNLDIIVSGTSINNPSELISSHKLKELIERLKKHYEYIILDTPPIGLYTDTRVLFKQSDIVLYIVRANYSKKEFVKSIDKLYSKKYIKKFGIILNATKDVKGHRYIYGYYS